MAGDTCRTKGIRCVGLNVGVSSSLLPSGSGRRCAGCTGSIEEEEAAEPSSQCGGRFRFLVGIHESSTQCFPTHGGKFQSGGAQSKCLLSTTHYFLEQKSHIPHTWGDSKRDLAKKSKLVSLINCRGGKTKQRWNLKLNRLKRHSTCNEWALFGFYSKLFIRKFEHWY